METQDQQIVNSQSCLRKESGLFSCQRTSKRFFMFGERRKSDKFSTEFKISKQQISDICKNQEKILKFTDKFKMSEAFDPKSLKVANDEQVDKALYACVFQQRHTGMPISGLLLQEKAKHFSVQLNAESAERESFKASTGWSYGHLKHLKLFYMSIQNNTQTYQLYINASKS